MSDKPPQPSPGPSATTWIIDGADERTGEDVRVRVSAESRSAALREAQKRRILVASISPAVDDTLSYAAQADLHQRRRRAPPSYGGLTIASTVIGIIAGLYYGGGAVLLVLSLIRMARLPIERSPEDTVMALGSLMFGIVSFGAGAVFHGIAAACVALRDMARNSWRDADASEHSADASTRMLEQLAWANQASASSATPKGRSVASR